MNEGSVTFRRGAGLTVQMRLGFLLVFALTTLRAQLCPPDRILPAGTISGSLDNSSCQLSDATAYAAYRLDLPTRGQMQIDLTTSADFLLVLRDGSGAKIDSGASVRGPVEAGSYTLLVNARAPGQGGRYSVRTSFTPEPGTLCSAFPSLGLSQTVTGALGSTGCALPDGALYEGYLLGTFGAGTLTVNIATSDFAPSIFVRTPDGAAVAAGDTSVTATVDGDTLYEVVVATNDKTGTFQLTTSFAPADGETCRATKTVSGSGADNGVITPDSCTATIPGSGDLAYYNYYQVTVPDAGLADIGAVSGDFDATLYLLDEGGNTIASDAGSVAGGGAHIRMQLRSGTYTVEVFSLVASGGAYQLSYQITPGAPQPCPTSAADPSGTQSGNFSTSGCLTEVGPANLYTMSLPQPGTLDLVLTSDPSLAAILAIRDTKDNLLLMNQDLQGLGMTRLSVDLPAGAYTVATGGGSGFYQVTSKFTAHEIPACGAPQTLDINGGYVQRLGPGSCRGANGGPVDWYQFTLPADATVAMIMTSGDVDGYLSLTDASGKLLRSDDNRYGFGDPLIIQYLSAGTYRLAARSSSSSSVNGLYEVDVRSILGPRPPFCAPKATLPIGGSVSGTASFASCQYIDATFADVYRIQVTNSAPVDLRLNSSAFDAYLILLDSKGNLVDQDDDGGGGTNARINRLLAPGTYYVIAKPVSDYTSGGAYTLTAQ